MKTIASTTLKSTWKCRTWRRTSLSTRASPSSTHGSASENTMQPGILKSRLPKATWRPLAGVRAFTKKAMSPLPRFAPSTRHSATGTETTFVAARVAVSRTTARLENESTVKLAPISMSSIGSPESVAKITRTPCACVMGLVASITSCNARMMSPNPIPTRPSWPILVLRRERKKITPKKMSSGESHDRSSEKSCAMSAVPTSAPSMMASAAPSPIRFCDTKELALMSLALDDWTRLVTPSPARNAEPRPETLFESTRRRVAPYTRRIPGRTMCVPQTRSATLARRLRSISIGLASAPGQAEGLQVGEALHRLLHAFLVAQPRILDAAEGSELEAVSGDFAHVHGAHVELAHEARDVVEAVCAHPPKEGLPPAGRGRQRPGDAAQAGHPPSRAPPFPA